MCYLYATLICIIVCGQIKCYYLCHKSFVNQFTTGCNYKSGHKLSVKPSKKHKQGFIICVYAYNIGCTNSGDTNFHQPSLRRIKLCPNLA